MITQRRLILFAVLALLLSACANSAPVLTPAPTTAAAVAAETPAASTAVPTQASSSGLTPATIADDEGGLRAAELAACGDEALDIAALWAITQSITGYEDKLLVLVLNSISLWMVFAIFFLAGLAETYGTRAVVLFLNKVGRRPFFITLLLTAVTYVFGGLIWAITIDGVLKLFYDGGALLLAVVLVAMALGYIPLLFAFLAAIPDLGPAILVLLQGLSLLTTTAAISVGYGLPFLEAALATIGGWLVFRLLRWFTAGPATLLSRQILRLVTGREVNYQLRDVVPTVPLGLQSRRWVCGEGDQP